jgi:hypothetical protein
MTSEVSKARERIKALDRRCDFLAIRVAGSDKDLSFDKQELSALRWAIRELTAIYGNAGDGPQK